MNIYKGIDLSGRSRRKISPSRFFLLSAFVVALLATVFGGYAYFAKDMPNLRDLTGYQPVILNEFYDSNGELMAHVGIEKRALVNLDDIPEYVRTAFIAIEDRRFYQHSGVDAKSVIRALAQNLTTGKIVSGGSTITQQVTKNLILGPQKSYARKIKEAILSARIEKNLSKDEILYLYLNHIYLADGVYGVEMASRNYFGKSVRDINIAEACLLAGIPRRPEFYSPRLRPETALRRQKTVIKIMHEQGFITQRQKQEALDYEIEIVPRREPRGEYIAAYFVEHVRKYLEEKVGKKAYEKGGYKVYTTLDLDLNLAAYRALRQGIRNVETRHGRDRFTVRRLGTEEEIGKFRDEQKDIVLQDGKIYQAVITSIGNVDTESFSATIEIGGGEFVFNYIVDLNRYLPPPTGLYLLPEKLRVGEVIRVRVSEGENGEFGIVPLIAPQAQGALMALDTNGNILSMVGGYDFSASKFNRAVQAKRQPGSAFKPFLYAAAIDSGYTQTSKLLDVPIIIDDWAPENYDEEYMGAIFFRESLVNSRNLSSIRLIMDIDPKYVADYSRSFGFKSRIDPYPSLALGSSEVTLLEITSAYSVFANAGVYRKPNFILRIYDRNGSLVEDNTGEMYLAYEKKLRYKQEREEENREGRHRSTQPMSAASSPPIPSVLTENRDEFVTAEEFQALVKKVPIYYFAGDVQSAKKVISPETAYIMTDILKGVVTQGTGIVTRSLNAKAAIAGKTGTTNDYTDAWFIGYSPILTAGVWVGKDDNTSLGEDEAGSVTAAPVWKEFMSTALDRYSEYKDFEIPKGIEITETAIGEIAYKTEPTTISREDVLMGIKTSVDRKKREKSRQSRVSVEDFFRIYGN